MSKYKNVWQCTHAQVNICVVVWHFILLFAVFFHVLAFRFFACFYIALFLFLSAVDSNPPSPHLFFVVALVCVCRYVWVWVMDECACVYALANVSTLASVFLHFVTIHLCLPCVSLCVYVCGGGGGVGRGM